MSTHIRVIDLETTGFTPPEHGVCEIGFTDLCNVPDRGWEVGSGGDILINPGRPIPPVSSAIHHITDADVAHCAMFEAAAQRVFHRGFQPLAYAAHNAKFERQWCTDEMTGGAPWICTYKAALRLWPEAPGHSNQALRYWRNPEGLDREIASKTHRAFPDAYVTAHLLREMLSLAPLEDLFRWTQEPALLARCPLRQCKGLPWSEVDEGLLHWIAQRDFDEDIHFTVRHELARRHASTEGAAA